MKPKYNPLLGSFLIAFTMVQATQAANIYWDAAPATDAWGTLGNWNTDGITDASNPLAAPGTGDVAIFNRASTISTISAAVTAGSITFDTATAGAYIIGTGAANSQTYIMAGGTTHQMTGTVANDQTYNARLQLGGDRGAATYNISNASATNKFIFNGSIVSAATGGTAGVKVLAVSGAGNIDFNGQVTRNGGATSLTLTKGGAGTLKFNNATSRVGLLTLNGGIIDLAADLTIGDAIGGGQIFNGTGGTINTSGGRILLGGGATGGNGGDWAGGTTTATTINAVIANGGSFNNIDFYNAGTVILNGANTYTGGTGLYAAAVRIGVNSVGSVGSITSSAFGTGSLTFQVGANVSSDSTTARTILNAITFANNATLGDATRNGKLTFSANANLGTALRTITTNSEVQFDGILSGALGGVNKAGAGMLVLTNNANSYTGITGISAGTLNVSSLSDYGVASSIGARAALSETATGDGIGLRIGTGTTGATLQYTGSTAQSTNRQIRISAANNSIDASGTGTGTISFTYSGANTNLYDTAGDRTLTLTGSNAGDNTFGISLTDQDLGAGNLTTLAKTGAGKWVLTGVSSHTGGTNINNGILSLSGSGTTGSTTGAIALGGGQLNLGGLSRTVGAVTITAAASGDTITNGDLTASSYAPSLASGTATLSANLLGAAATFTKTGAGIVKLTGANTYGGTTTLTTGTIQIGAGNVGSVGAITSSALGTGTLTFNGGTLSSDSTTARTILNAVTFANNVTLGDATNNGKLTFAAGLNLGATARTMTINSDVQLDGAFTNPGIGAAVTKAGAGTLTINASNAGINFGTGNPGGFQITAGKVIAANTAAFGSAGQIVTLNGGTGTPAGSTVEFATDSSPNAYLLNQNSGNNGTVILNRATSGTAISYSMGAASLGSGNTINVQKGGNVTDTPTLSLTGLSMSAGSGGSTTLNPTTAFLSITGTVSSTSNNAKTLILGGSSAGNTIGGNVVNGTNVVTLTKSNTSTWTLSGNNTYGGVTTVNAGTLILSGTNTGAGATNVVGGTLRAGAAGAFNPNSAVTMTNAAAAVLDLNGNNNSIGSLAGGGGTGGNVTLGAGTLTTGGNNTSTAYSGNISGNGGLTKTGSGVFTLSTAQGYLGATSVNAGSLIVNSTLASSGVTVADLGTLGGIGTITNAVAINSGGTLSAATATTAGTLTVGSLTLDAGSLLAYEFGGTSDLISVNTSGGLTINGGVLSLYGTGGVTPLTTNGTYSLFNYSGTLGGAIANLTVGNSQAGKAYSLNDTGSVVQLILGDATSSAWSDGSANGLWSDSGNWTGGGVPNSLGALANFNIAGSTVAVDGAKTVGSIIFDNATGYTITGGGSDTITLDNGIAAAAISTVTGSHAINAPINLISSGNITPAASTTLTLGGDISGSKGMTFSGAGTTILSGTNSHTTTSVTAGKLQIGAGGASGTLGSGAVTLSSGTTLEFNRTGTYSASNNITGAAATLTMTNGDITLSGTKALSILNLAGGNPIISGTNTISSLAVTGGNSDVSGSTITTATVSNGSVTFSGTNSIATASISGGGTTFTGSSTITTLGVSGGTTDVSGATITTANVSGGTVTFSGTNSLTTLNLSGGTAKGGSVSGFGTSATLSLSGTGTLDLNGANASFVGNFPTGVAGNTITDNSAGAGTSTVTFNQTSNTTISTAALISDGATKDVAIAFTNNNGAQIFTNTGNTFSGGLTLLHNATNGTRLQINAVPTFAGTPGALTSGNYGTGTITVGQTAADRAGIYISAGNVTLANAVVANTGEGTDRVGTFRIDSSGNTFSGELTAGASDFTLSTNGTGAVNLTGKITGSNGLRLRSHTLGGAALTVTLTNAAETNDYAGNTTINDNAQVGRDYTLVLGASNQIPNGAGKGNVVINTNGTGDGTLRLQGFSDTINGLSGNGTVTTTVAGASVLTLGDNNATSSFSGIISNTTGTIGITKIGNGTQTFDGANSYAGATTINGGTLALGATGSIDNTSGVALGGGTFDVSAKSGYTVNNLTGSGDVVGALTVSTTLAIGNSPGEISFANNLTLGAASVFNYELTGGASAADLGLVSGDLTLASGAVLDLFQLGTYTLDDVFTLFAYDNALSGTFAGLAEGATFTDAGGEWRINYGATTAGANFTGSTTGLSFVNITAVPEPSAMLLAALGSLLLFRRRRA